MIPNLITAKTPLPFLGRRGVTKGGAASAAKLSAVGRKQIAKIAALARWRRGKQHT